MYADPVSPHGVVAWHAHGRGLNFFAVSPLHAGACTGPGEGGKYSALWIGEPRNFMLVQHGCLKTKLPKGVHPSLLYEYPDHSPSLPTAHGAAI